MALNDRPIIAYDNKAVGVTLTASSEDTGWPKENVIDWRRFTKWKPKNEDSGITETAESTWQAFGKASGNYSLVAQVFTITNRSRLVNAIFKLQKQGAPGDYAKCKLYSTTGSPAVPNALLVTSATDITVGAAAEYTFVFNYDLDPGVYALVLDRSGGASDVNYYEARDKDSDEYAGGHHANYPVGGPWAANTGRDFYFKTTYTTPDQWLKIDLGSPGAVKGLGISGHNLNTIAASNVVLQYSSDDITYNNCLTPFTPTNDKTLFKFFTEVTYRYFKLLIPSGHTAPPEIGVWFVGGYFQFERYVAEGFDPDAFDIFGESADSEEGELLGTVETYRKRVIPVTFNFLTYTFIENTWLPFWDNHIPKPFFWIWDKTNHPNDAYLLKMQNLSMDAPFRGSIFRSITFTMGGLKE